MGTTMQEATTFMFWVMIFGIIGLAGMVFFAWFFSENEVRRRFVARRSKHAKTRKPI
jgi:uncharacterized membrane protein YuzA (DUF378 family)